MEPKYVVLRLILDSLGVSSDPGTFPARKDIQKAIYLTQRAGVDLGYRFGWYIKGPYCPPLARDYFGLKEAAASEPVDFSKFKLNAPVQLKVGRARPLLKSRVFGLKDSDWLELIASLDYLTHVAKESPEDAMKVIETEKKPLSLHSKEALAALRAEGLLA